MTVETDLAVVGGGIIGCFAAHHAARDQRVVLLEQAEIGAGATAWSAGVSFPLAATPGHRVLVQDSAVHYEALRGCEAARFLRPVPMVYVVSDDRFRGRVVGTGLRPVTADERRRVARMLPGLRVAPGEEMLTHDGHGFAVDARGLARWLVADGVSVHTGHEVTGIRPDGDGYRVTAQGAEWFARRVVVATGPWPGPQPRPAEPVVRTKWVAALHADLDTEPGDPLVYVVDDDLFFLPQPTGKTLVSFYRDVWDVDPAAATGRPGAEDLRVGTAAVRHRCPAAADAVTGGRAFCDAYAPDRLPLVTPHLPGLVSIRGGSGSGVRLAPALAAAALRATDHPSRDPATSRAGRR